MGEWSLSVSELNEYVRRKLAGDAMLRNVSVRGEIVSFKRHVSGHLYFTLKDEQARVSCAMFRQQAARLDFQPADGMQVVVTGAAGLYPAGGTYQLYVDAMRREGAGDLFKRFEMLKRKLADEGLFDPALKKPLPLMPKTIGVATSAAGAAFHDIVRVARARNPRVGILLCPCAVQGVGAAEEIAAAVRRLDEDGRADVILVGRGGGSMEDLWAFNEEVVARAVAVCRTPVVSCVGHEIDFTICDFAADVRAATPSNAAELAVGDVREWRAACDQRMIRLTRALSAAQRQRHLRLNACGQSAYLRDPARMLTERRRDRLEHLYTRLALRAEARVSEAREKLKTVSRTLEAMNPENVLARGYACVRVNDRIVTDAAELSAGQHFSVDMHAARVRATVDGVDERK